MSRIRIPEYAKANARKGLKKRKKLSKSKKYGLSSEEASRKGINSGVERARQLIDNGSLSREDANEVKSFLARNKGQADQYGWTTKILGSRRLWGGEKSGRFQDYLERRLE